MNRPIRITAIVLACASAAWIGYTALRSLWLNPRAERIARIEAAEKDLRDYQAAIDRLPLTRREIRDVTDRTLGSDRESVDHQLRTRLNRMAELVQLREASVGTTPAVTRGTPARSRFSRSLRDEPDFVEVPGYVSGRGSLEQVIQLVDRIQAEPWIKRIDQVKLDPVDNGQTFGVTVRLTTLFVPGRGPEQLPASTYDAAQFARLAGYVQANPFRVPPPPAPVVAKTEPPPPPPFPYDQWAVTILAEGPDGPEVWLRNKQSNENRRLIAGQSLQDATFVAIRGVDVAEFQTGNQRFTVALGGAMSDRSPVNQ